MEKFTKWTGEMMIMHKALHPKDDIDKLYVSRKKEGGGFGSTEDCVDATIQCFEEYIKKSKERLITAVINSNVNVNNSRTNS